LKVRKVRNSETKIGKAVMADGEVQRGRSGKTAVG